MLKSDKHPLCSQCPRVGTYDCPCPALSAILRDKFCPFLLDIKAKLANHALKTPAAIFELNSKLQEFINERLN